MKLFCKNTAGGLVPMYDSDYEEKRKLKIGKVYQVEIRVARNYQFLKKYFALINCAWEYQSEQIQAAFHGNKEVFRKSLEVTAGFCERIFNCKLNSWVDVPKSVSFGAMSAEEFSDLYERVKDVLWAAFLKGITREEFEENLANF